VVKFFGETLASDHCTEDGIENWNCSVLYRLAQLCTVYTHMIHVNGCYRLTLLALL